MRPFYIVLDTETSSFEVDRGEVIQLSAIKVDCNTGEIIDLFDSYLKTTSNARIDFCAMKATGISKAVLKNKGKDRKQCFEDFNTFCKLAEYIVGYNVGFDINMLQDDMRKEGLELFDGEDYRVEDAYTLAKDKLCEIKSYKLSSVAPFLGYNTIFHNSLNDVLATNYVYRRLLNLPIVNDSSIVVDYIAEREDKKDIEYNVNNPIFEGLGVCISGDFEYFSRDDIKKIVTELGGNIKTSMTKAVNLFINGCNNEETEKERKYKELSASGYKIRALDEDGFLNELAKTFDKAPSLFGDSRPFTGQQVVFVGKNPKYSAKDINHLFRTLGADVKTGISKNVSLLFAMSELTEEQKNDIDSLKFNGFGLNVYGVDDVEKIIQGQYEPYKQATAPVKKVIIDRDHISANRIKIDRIDNLNIIPFPNPIGGKDIHCSQDVPGNKFILGTMIGYLGATFNVSSMDDSYDTILVTKKTIDDLYDGKKSSSLQEIEDYYNASKKVYFKYGFLVVEDLLDYIAIRNKSLNAPEMISAYDDYMRSI